jgi:L-alanine-DL-glutamate epimerase-like enolase superfamily enzyme
LGSLRALGAEAKPIRIQNLDIFDIEIPFAATEVQAGLRNRFTVVQIQTENRISGYSFVGAPKEELANIRELLIGQDVFGVDHFLKNGLLQWGGVEEALWGSIGKIANQPVHRLLGGCNLKTVPAYVTYAWPGDKFKLKAEDQVAPAIRVKNAGFKAIKFQCMRPRGGRRRGICASKVGHGTGFSGNGRSNCSHIRYAVGPPDGTCGRRGIAGCWSLLARRTVLAR